VNYVNNKHDKWVNKLGRMIDIEKVYNDCPRMGHLFDKFNVEFVPTGFIVRDGGVQKVEGALKKKNIIKMLQDN